MDNTTENLTYRLALSILWSITWRVVLVQSAVGFICGGLWAEMAAVFANHSQSAGVATDSSTVSSSMSSILVMGCFWGLYIIWMLWLVVWATKTALSKEHFGSKIKFVKTDDKIQQASEGGVRW